MTAIIKDSFRIQNSKDFLENFTASLHDVARNHYIFVGRIRPWDNDNVPDTTVDSLATEAQLWHEMLSCKKVGETYVSLVVPRIDWDATGNTVYVPFDNRDTNLFHHPTSAEITAGSLGSYTAGALYCVTDENHIFKCLGNNNGAKSTIKPSVTLSAPYISNTADGYAWKYMGTVTASQSLRFMTEQWLPVKTLGDVADDGSTQWDVEQNATAGTIDSVIVDNKGSDYTLIHSGTVVSATSTTAELSGSASGAVNAYVGATIYLTGGTGYPATAPKVITAYNETTKVITVGSTWSIDATTTYDILPTITLSGDGTGAILKPVMGSGGDANKVVGVTILEEGTGYHYATASLTGCGGAGAIVAPQVAPGNGHGSDIEKELGAFFSCLNVRLEYAEGAGDFPTFNDYRQIGLVRDLKNFDGSLATADTRIATKKLTLSSVAGTFLPDEVITGVTGGTTAVGRVVDFDSGGGQVTFVQDTGTGFIPFQAAMALTGGSSLATATISSITNEEVKKFDGEILYVQNRRAVVRSEDQLEDIKIIIEA